MSAWNGFVRRMLLAMGAWGIVGCDSDYRWDGGPSIPRMERFERNSPGEVRQAVENAKKSDYAILFVHVDWAPMSVARERFEEFACRYISDYSRYPVGFHYVDFHPETGRTGEDYSLLEDLDGWKELQEGLGHHPVYGFGEVLWMRRGTVVECKSMLAFKSAREASVKTNEIFSRRTGERP